MSWNQELENLKGMTYECLRCGLRFQGEEMAERGRIVCIRCGYRVIKKVRPPIAKRVKAK